MYLTLSLATLVGHEVHVKLEDLNPLSRGEGGKNIFPQKITLMATFGELLFSSKQISDPELEN